MLSEFTLSEVEVNPAGKLLLISSPQGSNGVKSLTFHHQ